MAAVFVGLCQVAGAAYAQGPRFTSSTKLRSARTASSVRTLPASLVKIKQEGVTKLGLETLQTEIKTEDDALKPQVTITEQGGAGRQSDAQGPRGCAQQEEETNLCRRPTTSTRISSGTVKPLRCPHSPERSRPAVEISAKEAGCRRGVELVFNLVLQEHHRSQHEGHCTPGCDDTFDG